MMTNFDGNRFGSLPERRLRTVGNSIFGLYAEPKLDQKRVPALRGLLCRCWLFLMRRKANASPLPPIPDDDAGFMRRLTMQDTKLLRALKIAWTEETPLEMAYERKLNWKD